MKTIGGYEVPKGLSTRTTKYIIGVEWMRGEQTVATLKETEWGIKFIYYTPSGRRMEEYGDDGYRKCVNNIKAVDRYEAKIRTAKAKSEATKSQVHVELQNRFGAIPSDYCTEYIKEDGHRIDYRIHKDEITILINMKRITDEQVKDIITILRA